MIIVSGGLFFPLVTKTVATTEASITSMVKASAMR